MVVEPDPVWKALRLKEIMIQPYLHLPAATVNPNHDRIRLLGCQVVCVDVHMQRVKVALNFTGQIIESPES
jgi:hypothetical protein